MRTSSALSTRRTLSSVTRSQSGDGVEVTVAVVVSVGVAVGVSVIVGELVGVGVSLGRGVLEGVKVGSASAGGILITRVERNASLIITRRA